MALIIVVAGNALFRGESTLIKKQLTLVQSEEKFRALIEASSQIVWSATATGEIVEDSPSWRGFTGQTYEDWKGKAGSTFCIHTIKDARPILGKLRPVVGRLIRSNIACDIARANGAGRWRAELPS